MSNNYYEPELKATILRLYLEEGRTKKSLTEEYHLGQGTITYWLQQRRKECQTNPKIQKKTILMKKLNAYAKNSQKQKKMPS